MLERQAGGETSRRWELYRVLAEPLRLRVLALAAEDELAIGELSDLLREPQPNVSRHVQSLKRGGLLAMRKQGTRALVRVEADALRDAVIADAVAAGRRLCAADGSLVRLPEVIALREQEARAFFASNDEVRSPGVDFDTRAHLLALGMLLPRRKLAIDVGTGDGRLLHVLAPAFSTVIGLDRSQRQIELAKQSLGTTAYKNVELIQAEYDDPAVLGRVDAAGGADAVFASRVLHHAPRPGQMIAGLAHLLRKGGGALVVVDYATHEDESLRTKQADVWLGFSADELRGFAEEAGLTDVQVQQVRHAHGAPGPDGHLDWQVMVARRA